MVKNIKKIISIMLLLLLTLFVGCSQSQVDKVSTDTNIGSVIDSNAKSNTASDKVQDIPKGTKDAINDTLNSELITNDTQEVEIGQLI